VPKVVSKEYTCHPEIAFNLLSFTPLRWKPMVLGVAAGIDLAHFFIKQLFGPKA